MRTIDSLRIFWTFKSEEGLYQDEVDGLIFYGFWKNHIPTDFDARIVTFQEFWTNSLVVLKKRVWESDDNAQLSLEVRIDEWPTEGWLECVENCLKWFVELGAVVAWCGTEYSSPSLACFDLDAPAGEVYAVYSKKTDFRCRSNLYDEYQDLLPEDIQSIKEVIVMS